MPRDDEQFDVRSDTNVVLVTLVHGTFARGTAWTQDGSRLRQSIAESLQTTAERIVFDSFDWSGRNTHRARIKAGYELATHIMRLRKKLPSCRHFIVAHSHGGNVALLAHKHLREDLHALGIATLGTPFVYARLEEGVEGKSLEFLMEEAPRHTDNVAGVVGWMVGIPIAIMSDGWLEGTQFDEFYFAIGSGIVAGILASVLTGFLFPYLARVWHLFGGKRAAVRLANAVRFGPIPRTHVLSFIYPGDEAQRLLDVLETTTALPSRVIRWINSISAVGFGAMFLGIIFLAIATSIAEEFVTIDSDAIADEVANWFATIFTATIFVWAILVCVRYVLSFLRGHPWGFGWERPSMHAHVEIGVEPTANVPTSKSYLHQEVPFSAQAHKGGMRHVGLYEDERILKALSYWMTHVK